MEDEQPTPVITPGQSPEQEASNPSNIAPDAAPPPPQVITSHSSHRGRNILLIIVVLLLAAAGGAYYVHNHNANKKVTETNTKHDIPDITYGLQAADLSQEYPFDANITVNRQVDTQLFESLVQYKQLTKIVPQLATSWSNPDNSTWIFNLQHGIKFHSGRTMTAADVKYSLDYAVAHQNDNNQNNYTYLASTIKSVDVLNSYQVKITTDGPDPILLNRLTYLYILDSKSKPDDFNDGTGPYVITSGTTPGASAVDLSAFNGYHGGHVYTRHIHFRIAANKEQLTQKAIDGTYQLAGNFSLDELAKIKNYHLLPIQDLGVSVLGLNTLDTKAPTSTLAGRQAMAYAMDVPAILKAGNIQGEIASQIIPIAIAGYDPSIKPVAYNPTKAKQLLATVSNASYPMTLLYNDVGQQSLLTEIAKELNAVGFNIKISEVDFNTELDEGLGGKVDMFYATVDTNTLDGADILSSALQGNQIYQSSQVDSMLSDANSILNPAKRLAALQKISRLVTSQVPYVPLYTQTRSYISLKPQYKIITNIPSSELGVYFWQTYQ